MCSFRRNFRWCWSTSRQLSQEISVSKVLYIHSHKIASFATIQKLKRCAKTPVNRLYWQILVLDFCDWFHEAVGTNVGNPLVMYFTNEPWFYLNSHVNTQYNRQWSVDNSTQDAIALKLGWCAISLIRLFKPIVFLVTINFLVWTLKI